MNKYGQFKQHLLPLLVAEGMDLVAAGFEINRCFSIYISRPNEPSLTFSIGPVTFTMEREPQDELPRTIH